MAGQSRLTWYSAFAVQLCDYSSRGAIWLDIQPAQHCPQCPWNRKNPAPWHQQQGAVIYLLHHAHRTGRHRVQLALLITEHQEPTNPLTLAIPRPRLDTERPHQRRSLQHRRMVARCDDALKQPDQTTK